jgi:DUF1365 family protein
MSDQRSCLYFGDVVHARTRPKRHRLSYRVFSLYVDVDEIETLAASLRLLSHNRANLYSFLDRDHGGSEDAPLRAWVERTLADAGVGLDGGSIRLLCYPRILGYVFNPLSIYFCFDRTETLIALIYEVNNTFGQRHFYVIPVAGPGNGTIRQSCDKRFYVSPFLPVAGRYHIRLQPPAERLSVVINYTDDAGLLLHAAFRGRRVRLDDGALLRAFFTYPLMTVKIIAGIHWEAVKLWRKRIPLIKRPPPPSSPVTIVRASKP